MKLSYEQGGRGGDAEKLQLALALLNLVAARAGDPSVGGGGQRCDVFRDVFDRLKWISYRSRQPSDTLGPYLAIVKRPPKARLAA